jgi:hypothetical protein
MTPKEKAIYLVEDFAKLDYGFNDKIEISEMHKRQALLAVSEIKLYLEEVMSPYIFKQYIDEVKKEIEKL